MSERELKAFVDEVNLVGIKAIYNTKHVWIKVFWIAMIFLGTLATCYYVYGTVKEFTDDPTAMKVEFYIKPKYDYPKVAICPTSWMDEEKIKSFNLSMNAVHYALQFAINFVEKFSANVGKLEYTEFLSMHNITNFFDFYYAIAFTSSNILCISTNPFDCKSNAKKVFLTERVCYEPILPLIDCTALTAIPPITLHVHYNYSQSKSYGNLDSNHNLYVDPQYNVFSPFLDTIPLFKGSYISIKIKPKKYVMLNRINNYPCVENDGYSQKVCHHHCMEEVASLQNFNCVRLSYFMDDISLFDKYQPCNMVELEKHKGDGNFLNMENTLSTCYERCLPSCTKLIYDVTTTFKSMPACAANAVEDALVEIIYDVCESGLETFTEFNRYSVESFIANIGGVLGLWIGASAVTFIQIFMYAFQTIIYSENGKKISSINLEKLNKGEEL